MDFRKFHLRVSFTNQMCSFRFFSHAAGRKADMMSFAHRLLVLHLVRRSGRTRLLFACLRQLCAHCLTCLRSQLSANTVLHPHRQKMFLANAQTRRCLLLRVQSLREHFSHESDFCSQLRCQLRWNLCHEMFASSAISLQSVAFSAVQPHQQIKCLSKCNCADIWCINVFLVVEAQQIFSVYARQSFSPPGAVCGSGFSSTHNSLPSCVRQTYGMTVDVQFSCTFS